MEQSELIKHMHDAAGKYHTHFSTVRAATSGLLVPIGILSSINLLAQTETLGKIFPFLFILFILIVTLGLNHLFSVWSLACLRIERYYETILQREDIQFDSEIAGFRNLFYYLTTGTQEAGSEGNVKKKEKSDDIRRRREYLENNNAGYIPERIRPYLSGKAWADPFNIFMIVAGSLYILAYGILLIYLCKQGV